MRRARCRWCGQVATQRCRARQGADSPTVEILYCGAESRCWDLTCNEVRGYTERTWTLIEQPKPPPKNGQPSLLDLLPEQGKPHEWWIKVQLRSTEG